MHECREDYIFEKNFLSKEKDVSIDLKEEVKNLLVFHGAPMKVEEMEQKLSYLPKEQINAVLRSGKEFIRNTVGEFFHISLIDLSREELEDISEMIQEEIDRSCFIGGNELIAAIRKRYPGMLERFPQFSDLGLRNAIAYYLNDRFSFAANIISTRNQQLSMTDVFSRFARTHSTFTLDELTKLKTEMNCSIYFDAVYENSLRISQTEFVSKEQACFDVKATDEAISAFCEGDYIPLKAITMFGTFPYAGFSWNIFLLEHYVSQYSKAYKLLHTGFNAENPVGAIVKESAKINNLSDLLVDVLAKSEIQLTKEDALQYLCDQGYLARKRLSDIDQILIKATAKRRR